MYLHRFAFCILQPGKLTEDLVDEEENKGHRSYIRAMVENVEKFGRKLYTYEDLSLSDSYKCKWKQARDNR